MPAATTLRGGDSCPHTLAGVGTRVKPRPATEGGRAARAVGSPDPEDRSPVASSDGQTVGPGGVVGDDVLIAGAGRRGHSGGGGGPDPAGHHPGRQGAHQGLDRPRLRGPGARGLAGREPGARSDPVEPALVSGPTRCRQPSHRGPELGADRGLGAGSRHSSAQLGVERHHPRRPLHRRRPGPGHRMVGRPRRQPESLRPGHRGRRGTGGPVHPRVVAARRGDRKRARTVRHQPVHHHQLPPVHRRGGCLPGRHQGDRPRGGVRRARLLSAGMATSVRCHQEDHRGEGPLRVHPALLSAGGLQRPGVGRGSAGSGLHHLGGPNHRRRRGGGQERPSPPGPRRVQLGVLRELVPGDLPVPRRPCGRSTVSSRPRRRAWPRSMSRWTPTTASATRRSAPRTPPLRERSRPTPSSTPCSWSVRWRAAPCSRPRRRPPSSSRWACRSTPSACRAATPPWWSTTPRPPTSPS